MNVVFRDLTTAGVVNLYLDDVIIPSKGWPDMLNNLQLVFGALRGVKLTLKPSKCVFGMPKLDYLGFTISKGLIQPGRKVEVISSYPSLKNEHEVQRFL